MGSTRRNNKHAGNRTELKVIKIISDLFKLISFNGKNLGAAEIGSSRAFSRTLDAHQVDVWTRHPLLDRLAISIKQRLCRQQAKVIDVSYLDDIDDPRLRVLVTEITRKSKTGRFMSKGMYVTMELTDFLTLIKQLDDDKGRKARKTKNNSKTT